MAKKPSSVEVAGTGKQTLLILLNKKTDGKSKFQGKNESYTQRLRFRFDQNSNLEGF